MSTAYSYHFDDDILGLSRSWTGFPARSVQVPSQREVPSLKFLFRLFRKSISKNQLLLGLGHAVKGPTGFKAFRCLEITTAAFKIFTIWAFEPFVAKKSKETAPPPQWNVLAVVSPVLIQTATFLTFMRLKQGGICKPPKALKTSILESARGPLLQPMSYIRWVTSTFFF